MENLIQDVKYAARSLAKSPVFVAVAVLTVALGIGATTTIFSVANSLIFRTPNGLRNHEELVTLHRINRDGSTFHSFPFDEYEAYATSDNGLTGLAAYDIFGGSLTSDGDPQILSGQMVTQNYFSILGTRPAMGRFFLPEEDSPGGDPAVVVLSYGTWQNRFGGDSSIIGTDVSLNSRSFTVVGVAEEGFTGHISIAGVGAFIPLSARSLFAEASVGDARKLLSLETIGRMQPGGSVELVQNAADVIWHRLQEELPEEREGQGADVRPYSNLLAATGPVSAFMALLLGISGLILMIASLNVASMLLSRASSRRKEIAVRQALGASRSRIVGQLLTESIVLFVVGGGVGIAFSYWTTGILSNVRLPIEVPLVFDFSPDVRVLMFTLALTLGTGLLFGLTPALKASNPNLSTALYSDSAGSGSSGTRLRGSFVGIQVAVSALLLVGAGLLLRGLREAGTVDVGFDPEGVGVVLYDVDVISFNEAQGREFFRGLHERVAGMPGVVSAAAINILPLSLSNAQTALTLPGRPQERGDGIRRSEASIVTPGYFQTMRISLLSGRDFTESDNSSAPNVVIINEEIARRLWPGENAVGKTIGVGSSREPVEVEIIGVVQTSKYRSLGEDPRFMIYRPFNQEYSHEMAVVTRGLESTAAVSGIRNVALLLEPDLPSGMFGSLEEINGIVLLPSRMAAFVATLFGSLGIILAGVGLYGLLSYSVSERTREIGIRIALGADSGAVRSMVVRSGMKLTAIGLGAGFALALAATRLMRNLLFGVSPSDPLTFGLIAGFFLLVAFVASYIPAIRATRTDPMEALRYE